MKYYPVVVLSDIHLGSEYSKIKEVSAFLSAIRCDVLILNGDIIDGWQLQKSSRHWSHEHTYFFKVLMQLMEEGNTRIIYVRGNHDDFLDKLLPFRFSNIVLVKEYMLESCGRSYYVTHGDIFDTVTVRMRWLARLGDCGYSLLLLLNKYYNRYRMRRGKSYYSFSAKVKHKIKRAVSYISDFENQLVELAKIKSADGVICGHIHHAANRFYGDIHYLNSGDWVESMTALVQDTEGNWEILEYADFMKCEYSQIVVA